MAYAVKIGLRNFMMDNLAPTAKFYYLGFL